MSDFDKMPKSMKNVPRRQSVTKKSIYNFFFFFPSFLFSLFHNNNNKMDKPNTPDNTDIPIIITQKPNTIDIIYDKPNTYEEEEEITTRQQLPQEVIDDLIVRAEFINGKRPPIKTHEQDESSNKLTSKLLSHTPSSTTSISSPPLPPPTVSPSVSSISSENSNTSSATSRLALLQILKSKPMEDMIIYNLRKTSLSRPHQVDIYYKQDKTKQAYKKVQPHSYSWGFQNILYKTTEREENIKIAEARRRAFKKEITIEWGDFPMVSSDKDQDEFNEEEEEEEEIKAMIENTTRSNQLHNKTNSHLLFTYETEFEGYKLRWKRASLLSHDLICELKYDAEENHIEQHKKWHVIAEFDSHRMGYFVHLGELIIDKNALKLIERSDHFEAHIVITCCTLIDLMREVVEKAIGLGKGGGVVGSD